VRCAVDYDTVSLECFAWLGPDASATTCLTVGAHVHVGPPNPNAPWITIVGIVGDTRNDPTKLTPEPMMFFAQRQQPFGDNVTIRTAGDPTALTATVRRTIVAIDPTIPIYNVATMAPAREREIGVRIALGATRSGIASLIFRQGGGWMAAELVAGGASVVFVGRFFARSSSAFPSPTRSRLARRCCCSLSARASRCWFPFGARHACPISVLR
jgi:hypothetical protein